MSRDVDSSARRSTTIGVACGLLVVLIWAGWVVGTRLAVKSHLRPLDVAFIRYLVASVALSPLLFRHGAAVARTRLVPLILLVAGAGFPFFLASSSGMKYAPASDAGAVMIGTMPVFVAFLSAAMDGERFDRVRIVGFAVVVAGIAFIAGPDVANLQSGAWRGHLLFLSGAALWAVYTLAMRRSGLGAWHAAALVNFWSLLVVAPIWLLTDHGSIDSAPVTEIITQAIVQGVLSAVVGLFAYGQAVRYLGASRASVLGSLTPAAAALLAIPVLAELPTAHTWVGIAVVAAGVALGSGALRTRRTASVTAPRPIGGGPQT